MTIFDYICILFAPFGPVWPHLAQLGPVEPHIWPRLDSFGPVWPHLVPLDPVWPVWSCLARFALFCSKKYIFKDNLKKEDNPQKEEYPNNVPKNGDYQKHEDNSKNAECKAPKRKTTQKIEEKK